MCVSPLDGMLNIWRHRKSNPHVFHFVHRPYGCLSNCKEVSAGSPDLGAAKSAD